VWLWGVLFGVRLSGMFGSAYRRYMIRGARVVVKGGFSGIRRRTQEGGIPAYAGMTGVGRDTTGWGWE